MSLDAKGAAALALHRFGLGPRAGSIAAIASDPRGALLAELDKPGIGQIVNAELMTAAQSATAAFNFRQERQARLIAQQQAEEAAQGRHGRTPWRAEAGGRRRMAPIPIRCADPPQQICLPRGEGAHRRGAGARDRLRRAAGVVLVEPFLRLGRS